MRKLWHLAFKSPINDYSYRVRHFAEAGGEGGAGNGAGADGDASGAGQGEGGQGAAGGQPTDWRTGLDPQIKDHACLKDFKSANDVVKSYVNVQPMIGLDKIPMPPKDAKPEVREKFLNDVFDRLGRPKEAKDYKFSDVKLPEGMKIDPAGLETLKTEAHKLGLLPHQLDGLFKWYANDVSAKHNIHNEQMTKSKQDNEASLRTEFGSAYDAKVTKAQALLNKFGGDDYKVLLDSGFGNDPAVIRFMAKMAENMSEDSLNKGSSESTMTPKEAEAEIAKVQSAIQAMDRNNPEYKILLQRKRDLYEMAYSTKG